MTVAASVTGVQSLEGAFDAAARELTGLASREAGELVARPAAEAAPYRTGKLAASHGVVVTAGRVAVVAAAPYAAFVHARNPWLARTLEAQTDAVVARYVEEVSAVVGGI